MGVSDKDNILIKILHDSKEYGTKLSFLKKGWSKTGLQCSVVCSCLPETNP